MIYDAIVVGGGVVGLSAAYHLVAGGARTLLLDRADPGRASATGAGILATAGDLTEEGDRHHQFETLAARYYPNLIGRLEAAGAGDGGYRVCGSLTVAIEPDEIRSLDRVRRGDRPWAAIRGGYVEIEAAAAKALFPPLAEPLGALHCGATARIDGRLLTAALLQAAEALGLVVRTTSVEGLLVEAGRVRGIAIAAATIASDHVVIAAGAWSNALLTPLGLHLPVAPQRGQIVHLDLGDVETAGWPIVLAFRGHYLVSWDDHRVVVGATRETGSGFHARTTAAGIMEVLREATRVAPGLAEAEVREIRVGLRPASRDGRPILGPAPGIANLHLATGHGASGLQLGPFSGKVIADAALGNQPEVDISPYTLARFVRSP